MGHGNVLIRMGEWTLNKRMVGSMSPLVGICHTRCQNSWMYHYAKGRGRCSICDYHIPDDVIGLWVLYNLDGYEDI